MRLIKALAGVPGDALTTLIRTVACSVVRPAALVRAGERIMPSERTAPTRYFFMKCEGILIIGISYHPPSRAIARG